MTKGFLSRFLLLGCLLLCSYTHLSALNLTSKTSAFRHELSRDQAISALVAEAASSLVVGLPPEADAHLFSLIEENEDNEVDSFKKQLRGSYHFILSFLTSAGLSRNPLVFPSDPSAKADVLNGRYLLLRIFRI